MPDPREEEQAKPAPVEAIEDEDLPAEGPVPIRSPIPGGEGRKE